jgi:hypothetical protein
VAGFLFERSKIRAKNKLNNMTQETLRRVEKIYGKNYEKTDIPAFLRKEEEEEIKQIVSFQKESFGQIARCLKCGDEIRADEDSICGRCI